MKIAIIGATGKVGHLILQEALNRKHQVTAFVRKVNKIQAGNVAVIKKDIFDLTTEDLLGFDVVIDAFGATEGNEYEHQSSLAHLIDILAGQKPRLLVVGGAGSLYVDDALSIQLMDTPDFPDAFKATANSMGKAFEQLKRCEDVNWTYICPAAFFDLEGARTGTYVWGKDKLLVNRAGASTISYADYALALLDEAEAGKYIKERISVCGS